MPRPEEPPADPDNVDTPDSEPDELAAEQAAADAAAEDPDPEEGTEPETVQPARLWPVYNEDRAHRELLAMEMITKGAPYRRVRQVTRLSPGNIRRLTRLVAEEARKPFVVRNVCRNPVHVGMPGYHGIPRQPPGTSETSSTDRSAQSEEDKPAQMAFTFD